LFVYKSLLSIQPFRPRQNALGLLLIVLLIVPLAGVFAQEETADTITIAGQVTNGTASGTVPGDLELTLFVITDASSEQFQTTTDENGAYSFADVPFLPDYTYVVTTAYRDHVFSTPLTLGSQLRGDPATLSLAIYELTEDPDVIEIIGMVTQVNVADDRLEVAQFFSISNSSDRAFSTSQRTPDGRLVSLVLPLPPGAIVAGFPEQNRYVFVQDDFTVFDTAPVLPGEEHIVQLGYFVSYDEGAIIEQELSYALNGPVRLLVRPETVGVVSEQLASGGPEVVGSAQYAGYGADLDLPSGGVIGFELTGQGGTASSVSGTPLAVSSDNFLPIAVVIFVVTVAIVVGVLVVYSNRRREDTMLESAEALAPTETVPRRRGALARETQLIDIVLEQIAALDQDFEANKIAKDDYQRQRAELKTRLSDLMRGKEE
jgi:hypothetical protein